MVSCDMIYLLSFKEIGIGIQAVLRFCFRLLKGSDVGITGGRDS
jgi:hypothetical protein